MYIYVATVWKTAHCINKSLTYKQFLRSQGFFLFVSLFVFLGKIKCLGTF